MITLKQISQITGFSTSTVSKALNNRLDINRDTRKQIQEIAIKNNYIPNKNAVALRKRKSNLIAVIIPQVKDYQYSSSLYEIQKIAAASGFRILLFQSFENPSKEKQFIEEIKDGSVDAALVISSNNTYIYRETGKIPIEYISTIKNQLQENLPCISTIKIKTLIERI